MRYGRTIPILLLSSVPLLVACASGGGTPEGAPAGAAAPAEPVSAQLQRALAVDPLGPDALRLLARLDGELGADLNVHLAAVAEDTAAPVAARHQALRLLGRRNGLAHLRTFDRALLAESVEIRVAAVEGLGELLPLLDRRGVRLLRRGLDDADPRVQAQALEALGARDARALEAYLAGSPPVALRSLAEELVRVARARGAALAPADTLPERLERHSPQGARVVFRAERRWPSWGAATGELAVAAPGAAPALVADGVEVVGNVIPAFFSRDARSVVFEVDRTIRVRGLDTGEERTLGPGIAPRPLPFTNQFVFLRERVEERTVEERRTQLYYDVLAADFSGGATEVLGTLRANARMEVHGNYSPVRWMRVRQRGERFYLEGPGVDAFRLPDPFAITSTAP